MKRFLRYALEHDRRIRAVFLRDGKMMQKTVSVLAYDGETVTLRAGAKGSALHVARGATCSAATMPAATTARNDRDRGEEGRSWFRRSSNISMTHEKQYEMIRYLFAGGPDHAAEHGGALWLLLSHGRKGAL